MLDILIRALPHEVHNALKRQASLNGRSLQREVQAILGDAVTDALGSSAGAPTLHVSDAPLVGMVGREEIYHDGR